MNLFNILFRMPQSSIGGITMDVALSETHTAQSEISENPIETGESVADHVRLMPLELEIEGIISDSPITVLGPITGIFSTITKILGNTSRSIDGYNQLLTLWKTREPFVVVTGLKVYENMILTNLSVPRNAQNANAIQFTATMRQVLIIGGAFGFLSGFTSLGSSVANIAQKAVNLGKKVVSAIDQKNPLSVGSSAVSSKSTNVAQQLFESFKIFH